MTEIECLIEKSQPFLREINRLEREYGFDRPDWQYQPLMIELRDLKAFREALLTLQDNKVVDE